jgi:deoxyribonuclease V
MDKEEVLKKYNINLEKLENEQIKLARPIVIKDKIDFSLADRFGAVDIMFIQNKILCSIIVCNGEYEIIDRAYTYDKARFPYLPGFRAYRELPYIVETFNKLSERPDVLFVPAQGIMHPRLGLASHLALSINIPTIGVSNSSIDCEIKDENILKNGEIVGKCFIGKPGSRAMFISPGNDISVESSLELCKKFINLPHKLPEPLHLAGKYGREVKKELLLLKD